MANNGTNGSRPLTWATVRMVLYLVVLLLTGMVAVEARIDARVSSEKADRVEQYKTLREDIRHLDEKLDEIRDRLP